MIKGILMKAPSPFNTHEGRGRSGARPVTAGDKAARIGHRAFDHFCFELMSALTCRVNLRISPFAWPSMLSAYRSSSRQASIRRR